LRVWVSLPTSMLPLPTTAILFSGESTTPHCPKELHSWVKSAAMMFRFSVSELRRAVSHQRKVKKSDGIESAPEVPWRCPNAETAVALMGQ
jgi:hypothetical protein